MTAPPPLESYELYVLKDERWQVHARFEAKERKNAIREAKRLAELPDIQAVKVVKDDVDPEQGKNREQTIFKLYRLERGFPKPSEQEIARGQQHTGSRSSSPGSRRGGSARIAAATVCALVAGAAGAGALYVFPTVTERLPQNLAALPQEALAGGAFAGLCILVFMAALAFGRGKSSRRRRVRDAAPPAMPEPSAIEVDAPTPSRPAAAPLEAPAAESVARPRPAVSQPVQTRSPVTPYAEKQIVVATRFVARLLRDADAEIGQDSPHMARGVDLFMAGAIAGLAAARALPVEEERRILREVLQLVGRRARQAQGFIDSIESELARHARGPDMIAAGREAMVAFLAGASDVTAGLTRALGAWRGDDTPPQRDPVTFLFVDVAPFADPALMRDEVLMQNAIHVRNRLFRTALGEFGGTEIRQTLRGLMAAFPDTKRGVDAAVKMQIEAVAHTQTNADLPVHLQTGLDCGDAGDDERRVPDAAETAAWICRKAQRDQILVSSSVRDGAADHSLPFKEAGTLARENLYDAIPLFEVVWRPAGSLKELETAH